MTKDPREGVDERGFLRTGAARDRVDARFESLIQQAGDRREGDYGDDLDSLYLYESVATGQARSPWSDLDLLAVWRTPPADRKGPAAFARRLGAEYPDLVRDVGLAEMTLAHLALPGEPGLGNRAFVRHYCVPLRGDDLRAGLAPVMVDDALARGFNGPLHNQVKQWRARLTGTSEDAVGDVARSASRRLLLAVATTLSVRQGGWSTDRATGVELVARLAPHWAEQAERALSWCGPTGDGTAPPPAEMTLPSTTQLVVDFGGWVAAGCPAD